MASLARGSSTRSSHQIIPPCRSLHCWQATRVWACQQHRLSRLLVPTQGPGPHNRPLSSADHPCMQVYDNGADRQNHA